MRRLLRLIKRTRWIREGRAWLRPDETRSDALADLGTNEDRLSCWVVDEANFPKDRLLAALAANKENIDALDYVTFELDSGKTGIEFECTHGQTLDDQLNSSFHCDLVHLSTTKINALARVMDDENARQRLQPKDVCSLISRYVDDGSINVDRLSQSIRKRIGY